MDYIKIILTSLSSFIVLFALAKIMGKRQMSQLSMFDYITGISIGSIAAEMATTLDGYLRPLIAMIIYAFSTITISLITSKSIKLRRFLIGCSTILYDSGELYQSNLKKVKLDINEFLELCRNAGYFDISKLKTVIMESNGKISFLPLTDERPASVKDLNLVVTGEQPLYNVIIDGKVMDGNLRAAGRDVNWLSSNLKLQKINDASQVSLATLDTNGQLAVFKRVAPTTKHDMFE